MDGKEILFDREGLLEPDWNAWEQEAPEHESDEAETSPTQRALIIDRVQAQTDLLLAPSEHESAEEESESAPSESIDVESAPLGATERTASERKSAKTPEHTTQKEEEQSEGESDEGDGSKVTAALTEMAQPPQQTEAPHPTEAKVSEAPKQASTPAPTVASNQTDAPKQTNSDDLKLNENGVPDGKDPYSRFVYAIGMNESGWKHGKKDAKGEEIIDAGTTNTAGTSASYGRFQSTAGAALDVLRKYPDVAQKFGFTKDELKQLNKQVNSTTNYWNLIINGKLSVGFTASDIALAKQPAQFKAKWGARWTEDTGMGVGDLDRMLASAELQAIIHQYAPPGKKISDKTKRAQVAKEIFEKNPELFARLKGMQPKDLTGYLRQEMFAENLAGFQMKAVGGEGSHVYEAINKNAGLDFGLAELRSVREAVEHKAKAGFKSGPIPIQNDEHRYMLCARAHNKGLGRVTETHFRDPNSLLADSYVKKMLGYYHAGPSTKAAAASAKPTQAVKSPPGSQSTKAAPAQATQAPQVTAKPSQTTKPTQTAKPAQTTKPSTKTPEQAGVLGSLRNKVIELVVSVSRGTLTKSDAISAFERYALLVAAPAAFMVTPLLALLRSQLGDVQTQREARPTKGDSAKDLTSQPKKVESTLETEAQLRAANAYNAAHRAYVSEFNELTGNLCAGGEAGVDPEMVIKWQSVNRVAMDGKVGPNTLHMAQSLAHPAEKATQKPHTVVASNTDTKAHPGTASASSQAAVSEQTKKPVAAVQKAGVDELSETDLRKLVASLGNAQVTAVAEEIAGLTVKSKELAKALDQNEEKGAGRDELVASIGQVRAHVAALDASGVDPQKLAVVKGRFYRVIQDVTPYYSQGRNIDILENNSAIGISSIKTRTCNITSLSMALEGLGKNADSYQGSKEKVLAVAKVFQAELGKAELTVHGTGANWNAMVGLRLPDFMELVAITECLGGKEATAEAITEAAKRAFSRILELGFLRTLAQRMGASAQIKYFSFDASGEKKPSKEFNTLNGYGAAKGQRQSIDKLIDARNKAEASQSDKDEQAYEKQKASNAAALEGKSIESKLSLQAYKDAVIKNVGADLDRGAAVETHVTQHYVRLQAIHEDYVVIDDPGQQARANKKVLWEEARAQGMFDYRIVIE